MEKSRKSSEDKPKYETVKYDARYLTRLGIAFFAVIGFVIVGIIAYPPSGEKTDDTGYLEDSGTSSESSSQPLELKDWHVFSDYSYTQIEGVAKNNTGHNIGYAQLTFSVYNKEEQQIGTALANINNWESGKEWKFTAICMSSGGKSAKFSEFSTN